MRSYRNSRKKFPHFRPGLTLLMCTAKASTLRLSRSASTSSSTPSWTNARSLRPKFRANCTKISPRWIQRRLRMTVNNIKNKSTKYVNSFTTIFFFDSNSRVSWAKCRNCCLHHFLFFFYSESRVSWVKCRNCCLQPLFVFFTPNPGWSAGIVAYNHFCSFLVNSESWV